MEQIVIPAHTNVFTTSDYSIFDAGKIKGVIDDQDIFCHHDSCERLSEVHTTDDGAFLTRDREQLLFDSSIRLGTQFQEIPRSAGVVEQTRADALLEIHRLEPLPLLLIAGGLAAIRILAGTLFSASCLPIFFSHHDSKAEA